MRQLWKSQTCLTCHYRKVKCDKTFPVCQICCRSGRFCDRPYKDGSLVCVRRAPPKSADAARLGDVELFFYQIRQAMMNLSTQGPSAGQQYQTQLLSSFLSEYLPKQSARIPAGSHTSFSWFEVLPNHLGENLGVDIALCALSLVYLGTRDDNAELITWSKRYHDLALQRIYTAHHRETAKSDHIIGTAMLLAVYQVYNCFPGDAHSWMLHIQAGCRLVEERGPNQPLNKHLLSRVRTVAFYDACARRKPCFFARPEWLLTVPNTELYDQLLSILARVPKLSYLCDRIKQSIECPDGLEALVTRFLYKFRESESKLREWYLDLLAVQAEAPFVVRPAQAGELSLLENDPDVLHIFPEVIEFSSRYMSQLLILAWMGFLTLYSEAATVMGLLSLSVATSLPTENHVLNNALWFRDEYSIFTRHTTAGNKSAEEQIADFEAISETLAVRVCQVIALCDKYTQGSAMRQPVMPPLWTAQQYFHSRNSVDKSAWCQRALQRFQRKGIRYGTELSKISYKGYVDVRDRYIFKGEVAQTGGLGIL